MQLERFSATPATRTVEHVSDSESLRITGYCHPCDVGVGVSPGFFLILTPPRGLVVFAEEAQSPPFFDKVYPFIKNPDFRPW